MQTMKKPTCKRARRTGSSLAVSDLIILLDKSSSVSLDNVLRPDTCKKKKKCHATCIDFPEIETI